LVKKVVPSCLFVVAGAKACQVFPEYAYRTDIQLVDSPPDMRPYYNRAKAVVVPLRSGSGTRLKILEAAAMMKQVVSTSVGAEGLNFINGETVLLADEPSVFALKVIQLLKNQGKANKISEAAYNVVKENYDWEVIRKITASEIKKLI
jgi:glycosyltransferase involved in cell wall biosynthesis